MTLDEIYQSLLGGLSAAMSAIAALERRVSLLEQVEDLDATTTVSAGGGWQRVASGFVENNGQGLASGPVTVGSWVRVTWSEDPGRNYTAGGVMLWYFGGVGAIRMVGYYPSACDVGWTGNVLTANYHSSGAVRVLIEVLQP